MVTRNLRSIGLFGQAGAGKTALLKALAASAGRQVQESHWLRTCQLPAGAPEDGFLRFFDTPGAPDFAGQALPLLAAVDTAIVTVDAQNGLEMSGERYLRWAGERGLCRMIVINRIDVEGVDLPAILRDLRERIGPQCLVLDLPSHGAREVLEVLDSESGEVDFDSVAAAHRALIDQIVEEDETLLARYLDDGADPSGAELHAPFEQALRSGHLIPVLFTSARTGAGVPQLLHVLGSLAPYPDEANPPPLRRGEAIVRPTLAPDDHVLAHVFAVAADPYLGKVAYFRVLQGSVRRDMALFVGDGRRPLRVAHLLALGEAGLSDVIALGPGEIGALSKADEVAFGDVLHDVHDDDALHAAPLDLPVPMFGLALETRRQGDEQRLFEVLAKLAAEDPTFVVERHPASNETVVRGLGELHLKSKLERMATQYKLEVDTHPPRIPYRETITAPAEAMYRHKKQSGGAGQFGEVHLRIEPLPRGAGFEFVDAVKGGAIPGVFMPAVEKGVRQALAEGVLAGFTVDDLKVTIFDGKTHPVDGKEIAFTIAARKALIEAVRGARPLVLEPIVRIEITAPESAMGDLAGDLAGRRGHVTGTDTRGRGQMAIAGEVPLAGLADYPARLKSLTAGQGSYAIEFARYAPVPPALQQQLAAQFRPRDEED